MLNYYKPARLRQSDEKKIMGLYDTKRKRGRQYVRRKQYNEVQILTAKDQK